MIKGRAFPLLEIKNASVMNAFPNKITIQRIIIEEHSDEAIESASYNYLILILKEQADMLVPSARKSQDTTAGIPKLASAPRTSPHG